MVAVEGGSWVIDKGRWHKTAWRGEKRVVPLTKEAVTVLQPFLAAARDDGYLFRAPRGKSVVGVEIMAKTARQQEPPHQT